MRRADILTLLYYHIEDMLDTMTKYNTIYEEEKTYMTRPPIPLQDQRGESK